MTDANRTLALKIEGPIIQAGKVPVTILADKLAALQEVFFNIGSALEGGGRKGTRKSSVTQSCSLIFLQAIPGSIEILTEIPQPSQKLLFWKRALRQSRATINISGSVAMTKRPAFAQDSVME